MNIEKLPKSLYDRAVVLRVERIDLNFNGGSDEGYLNVNLYLADNVKYTDQHGILENDIESWAWDVYDYSGAGDGNDYGDDITYDLVNKKVSTSEWFMERVDHDSEGGELEIDDSEDDGK